MPNFPFAASINGAPARVDQDGAGRIRVTRPAARNRPGALVAFAFGIGTERHVFYAPGEALADKQAHAWAARCRPGQSVTRAAA